MIPNDDQAESPAPRAEPRWIHIVALWPEALVVAAVTLLIVLPVWPGVHTVDSLSMLGAARGGNISNWYAPLHGWAWGVLDAGGAPAGTVLTLATVGVAVALIAAYRLWLGRFGSSVAAALTMLWPPFYGMLGWVGRDVWFLAYLIGTVALLGWSLKCVDRRRWLLAGAVLTALAAADARQNGIVLLPIVVGFVVVTCSGRRGWSRAGLVGAAAVAGGLCGFTAVRVVQAQVVEHHLYPEQFTYYYDLIGMSLETGDVLVPDDLFRGDELSDLEAIWNPGRPPLRSTDWDGSRGEDGVVVLEPYLDGGSVTEELARAWRGAIADHPLAYLEVRMSLYARQLALGHPARSVYYGSTDEIGRAAEEVRQRFPRLNEVRTDWMNLVDSRSQPRTGSILFAPWLYLLAGTVAAVVIARHDRTLRWLAYAILGFVWSLQLTVFVLAMSANFRYQLPVLVLCAVASVGGVVTLRRGRQPASDDDSVEQPSADGVETSVGIEPAHG